MKQFIAVGLIVVVLSGCSKHSTGIEATYVSPLQYEHLECSQINGELNRIEDNLAEVVKIHDREHNKDVTAAMAGIILLPAAALLMIGGGNRKEEIGRFKGEARALEEVATQKDCTDVLEEIERKRQEAEKKGKAGKQEAATEQ